MGAESFHADRRTDMTNVIVAFHDFATRPKDNEAGWASDLEGKDKKIHSKFWALINGQY